ncbi:hypothetical protein HDG33_002328 [Paraburkholderia sp. Cpub6]|nr:hypothetical protein [Paraburkholderia sp. Cpub6]
MCKLKTLSGRIRAQWQTASRAVESRRLLNSEGEIA